MKFKEMNWWAVKEKESVVISMNKMQTTMDRVTKFSGSCEKLFEKMLAIDGMKELLISEQDKLLDNLKPNASKDILKKFSQISNFSKKLEMKNTEMKKIVAEYRK